MHDIPNALRFEPSKERISKADPIWAHYVSVAGEADKESIETWNSDFETLPVFAGLFAAAVVIAIQDGFRLMNGTAPLPPQTFVPTARSVRVNGCFFISLAFSLMSAAGAMVSKVWCIQYARRPVLGSPHKQALRRQWHYNGIHKFRYQDVLDCLPVLLYTSIIVFMIGLCDYLYGLHRRTAIYVIVIFSCSFVFAATLTSLSIVLPEDFPYRIPLAVVIMRTSKYSLGVALDKLAHMKQRSPLPSHLAWWRLSGLSWRMAASFISKYILGAFIWLVQAIWTVLHVHLWWFWVSGWFARFPGYVDGILHPTDAFGSVVAAKPVDDGYSSMEVEALAWLVHGSPEDGVVNNLLKNIPIIVSTFKQRREFFIRNGAINRLYTLFEASFDQDWEGPYPGLRISSSRRKRWDMMDYGYSIYTLCGPETFPPDLDSKIACLQNDDRLSYRILGMALQSCQDPSFYLSNGELGALVSGAVAKFPPVSEVEIEMLLSMLVRAIQVAPHAFQSTTLDAYAVLCDLMGIRSLTSRTAALFCQGVHSLLFKIEMEAALHDYNPSLCAYYLSYQCVSHLDKLPEKNIERCSIIFMQIIQCLCNNEAQLGVHAKAQKMYNSFVCWIMSRPSTTTTYDILKEGVVTLSALSQKGCWGQQDHGAILRSCYRAASHPEATQGIIEESLAVSSSMTFSNIHHQMHLPDTAMAMIFYLEKELSLGVAFPGHKNLSIHYHMSSAIHHDIINTSTLVVGSESLAFGAVSTTINCDLFRYQKVPENHPTMLQSIMAFINAGLKNVNFAELVKHMMHLEINGQSHEFNACILHAMSLLPSVANRILGEPEFIEKIIELAGTAECLLTSRACAASTILSLWHRVVEMTGSWTPEQQAQWIARHIMSSRFLKISEELFNLQQSNNRSGTHQMWEVHNWLIRLEENVAGHSGIIEQSNLLTTMKAVLNCVPESQRQLVWLDKLGPSKFTITCNNLQSRLEHVENAVKSHMSTTKG
ncbi:hypothetical protein BD779DRAFT_1004715 [Infundibulicybe gibba]|nr:hypothetical protein BD779DRAFT_1004715 [Infundibulicybe gibba]